LIFPCTLQIEAQAGEMELQMINEYRSGGIHDISSFNRFVQKQASRFRRVARNIPHHRFRQPDFYVIDPLGSVSK